MTSSRSVSVSSTRVPQKSTPTRSIMNVPVISTRSTPQVIDSSTPNTSPTSKRKGRPVKRFHMSPMKTLKITRKTTGAHRRSLEPGQIVLRRWRPGTVALREIRKFQSTTHNLIPKSTFITLVRQLSYRIGHDNSVATPYRWQSSGIEALQCACENYLVELFEESQIIALHAKRITLRAADLKLAKKIRGTVGRI